MWHGLPIRKIVPRTGLSRYTGPRRVRDQVIARKDFPPASKLPQKRVDVNGSKVRIPNFGRCSDRAIVTNGYFDALRRGAAAQA